MLFIRNRVNVSQLTGGFKQSTHILRRFHFGQQLLLLDGGRAQVLQAVDVLLNILQPDCPDVHLGELVLTEKLEAELVSLVGAGPDLAFFELLQPVQRVIGQRHVLVRHSDLRDNLFVPSPTFLFSGLAALCQFERLEALQHFLFRIAGDEFSISVHVTVPSLVPPV